MKVTADTITDEQIRELFHPMQSLAVVQDALNALSSFVSVTQQREARARCAEILNARHCDGCDSDQHDVKDYVVTHHDGSTSNAAYCGDCADLARVDWNGETKSIARCAEILNARSKGTP